MKETVHRCNRGVTDERGEQKCPCINCESREIGCHGKCERYISWQAARRQEQERLHKIREEQYKEDEYIAKAEKRMSRTRRRASGRA